MEASIAVLVVVLLLVGAVALYAFLTRNVHIVVVTAFFLSGASALVFENLWTRMLRHVFGSTTLAISTVLTAFMGGLALGSYVFGRYADRIKRPLLVYGIVEGIVGVYALVVPFIVQHLYPYVNTWMWENFETSYAWLSVLRFVFSALVLILPSTMMGSSLPLLARHFVSRPEGMKKIGLNVGILYTLNTMGGIAGTFIAGFVLLPEIGQVATNYVAAFVNITLCVSILALRKQLLAEREDKSTYTERAGFISILVGIFVILFAVVTVVVNIDFSALWFWIFVILLLLVGGMLIFRGVLQGMEAKRGTVTIVPPPVKIFPISRAARIATLVAFFFSGIASMNYQVIWSRALSMVIGSSVYSFTIILLAFLVGIAIGSALYSSWMHRIRNPVFHLGLVTLFIGLTAVLNFLITDDLPFWFARLVVRNVNQYYEHIGTVQFFMFIISALAIIPVTIGMGAGFPLTIKIATSGHEHVGRDVGNIYAINTIGCIIGSFGSAFVFVPGFSAIAYVYVTDFTHGYGLQYAIYLSLIINFAMAFLLLLVAPRRPEMNPIKYVLAPLVPAWLAVIIAFAPNWNLAHMTLGTFRLSLGEEATDPDRIAEPDLVFYFDGISTTVSVERWGRHLALKNNGKVDASNGEDMSTQIMVAGYPLVFHPDGPEGLNLAVVGFGSGTSLGSAAQFPVNRVDIIELEPSISGPPDGYWTREEWERASEATKRAHAANVEERRQRAGARSFREINHDPWSIPWVNIINNDGRNYLASTSRRYEVIISEPSNPWITGVSDLFTIDHFRRASQALAPHGIFCQWVQLYELSPENIQAVFRAIAAVFPYMIVFAAEDLSSDTVILASYDPIPLDYLRVQRAMATPAVQAELERAGIFSPFDVFSRVILGSREEVLAYSSQATVGSRGCPEGLENQADDHVDPIAPHVRGVCVAQENGRFVTGGEGQCDRDADCRDGARCLSGAPLGVCNDARTLCTRDDECPSGGEEASALEAQCQVCAVEINTDDNSRIEFNAPRDLIGFERHEHYVGTFYDPDWPYGDLCRDPENESNCFLRNMGEGNERATNFANLGLSLLGSGKLEEARRFIEYSAEAGQSPRTELAARVYQYLIGNDNEPVPQFGPPVPAPQMPEETRNDVAQAFRDVMEAIQTEHWPMAIQALERIPDQVRRASGPDMLFLTAFLLYKNATAAEQPNPQYYREAARILEDLVRLEEDYVRAHPEVYYYLARCYRLDYSYDRARRYMVDYVEAITGQGERPGQEGAPGEAGGISDAEGTSPKDEHPEYEGGRTVPLAEPAAAPAAARPAAPAPAEGTEANP